MTSDWPWIAIGSVQDRHPIGNGLALDWHQIGSIDILIGNGLAPDWDRIGSGLVLVVWQPVCTGWMGVENVLRRDTSAGPYSKLVPRYSAERSPIDVGL